MYLTYSITHNMCISFPETTLDVVNNLVSSEKNLYEKEKIRTNINEKSL